MAVAAIDLVLEQELQELDVAQLPLARIGDAIGQRREQAAQAQPFRSADEIRVRSSIIRILLRDRRVGETLGRPGKAAGQRHDAPARAIRGRALQGGADDGFDAPDVQQLEGERPGAGRIDPVGAVALGESQEFLRLPQTRPRERAPQQHGDELAGLITIRP